MESCVCVCESKPAWILLWTKAVKEAQKLERVVVQLGAFGAVSPTPCLHLCCHVT